jgi:N4-gp56 family major capsid protein
MPNTTVAAANVVDQWSERFQYEYVRDMQFSHYLGKTENAPFQVIEDLEKKPGDEVTVSLITRLTNSGVTGDNTLEGQEEALGNYGHKIAVDQLRNAVAVGVMEQQKTHIELLDAAKTMLKNWAMDKMRDEIIAAMLSPNVDGTTAYASTAAADRNTWLVANSDRVLFGAAVANYSGVHATDLQNVDSTTDVLSPGIVSLAKRRAKTADRHIRPVRVDGQGEHYVLFAPSVAFRDFKNNATYLPYLEYAEVRGKDNPLFGDGDLYWDGVVVHEVPEIATLTGVGAAAIDVAPCFLVGAQAVGIAWAQRTKAIFDERDYGNISGRGVKEIRGIDKLMFNSIQNGVHTIYVSGVADA